MISTDRETLHRTPINGSTNVVTAIANATRCGESSGQQDTARAPDAMLDLVTQHRAWRAAYACAVFGDSDDEDAWFEANPNPAGDTLHSEPPLPKTMAGALAAVRFVMEDKDYIEKPHAAILKQALAFLESGATAGPTASSAAAMLLSLLEEHRAAHRHILSMSNADAAHAVLDEAEKTRRALSDRMAGTKATTLEGLRAKAEALWLLWESEGAVSFTEGRTTDMILAASILTDLGAPTRAGSESA